MQKTLNSIDELLNNRMKLNQYVIQIGVIDKNTGRKEMMSIGLTNAEVLFINEHGSPTNNMPARPVLHMTLQYAKESGLLQETLQRCEEGIFEKDWSNADIEKELTKMCIRMQNYCRNLIMRDYKKLPPNAPSVIKKKGYNHPLFETGQLVGSITCQWVRKNLT